jgi:hypothetical protein
MKKRTVFMIAGFMMLIMVLAVPAGAATGAGITEEFTSMLGNAGSMAGGKSAALSAAKSISGSLKPLAVASYPIPEKPDLSSFQSTIITCDPALLESWRQSAMTISKSQSADFGLFSPRRPASSPSCGG